MAGECLVIALILGVLNIGFFRAGRKNWGLAVLPLGFVPLATGMALFLSDKVFHFDYSFMLPMIVIVVSLMVSCIWVGMSSIILIKTRKMRAMYLTMSVGFIFTLSLILLINNYYALMPA